MDYKNVFSFLEAVLKTKVDGGDEVVTAHNISHHVGRYLHNAVDRRGGLKKRKLAAAASVDDTNIDNWFFIIVMTFENVLFYFKLPYKNSSLIIICYIFWF